MQMRRGPVAFRGEAHVFRSAAPRGGDPCHTEVTRDGVFCFRARGPSRGAAPEFGKGIEQMIQIDPAMDVVVPVKASGGKPGQGGRR